MDSKNQSAWSKVVDVVFLLVVGFLMYTKRIPDMVGIGMLALFQNNRGTVGAISKLLNSGSSGDTGSGGNSTPSSQTGSPGDKKPDDNTLNIPRIISPDMVRSSVLIFSIVSMVEGAASIGALLLKHRVATGAAGLVALGFLVG